MKAALSVAAGLAIALAIVAYRRRRTVKIGAVSMSVHELLQRRRRRASK